MKKFFKGLTKKTKSSEGPGKSPSLSRQSFPGAVSNSQIGYDVKEKDLTKLHKAAWTGDINKVRQLARKDPSPLDKENRTPLHLACAQGHDEVVVELLEWKAKTNVGDNESKTPLLRAVESHHTACVQLLIDYQAGLNVVDQNGDTALHYAVRDGETGIATKLIQGGANVNLMNKENQTPLHVAVASMQEETSQLLLQNGGNVDALDQNQRTALMLACYHGSINIVRVLLQNNADTTLKDVRGWSADDIAVMQAHHSCSQLITDHNVKLNMMKKQQSSASSTPRSGAGGSLFGSAPNTPRTDAPSEATAPLGIPAGDVGDAADDTDEELTSRASATGEYDSWGDDTDISLADNAKLKQKPPTIPSVGDSSKSDFNPSALINKLSAVKQDSNASSEINWSPDASPTTQKKVAVPQVPLDKNIPSQQDSAQSDDDTWSPDSSPSAHRKNVRVSFKRDDELSEVHDISVAESSENEASQNGKLEDDSAPSTYVPSSVSPNLPTHKKMRDINQERGDILDEETANDDMMAEFGISDIEDISEADVSVSESGGGDGDWNVSPEQRTHRPGILKNWKGDDQQSKRDSNVAEQNTSANNQLYTLSEEAVIYGHPYHGVTAQTPLKQAKPLEQIDWDSSEPIDDDEQSLSVQLIDRTFEDTDNLDLLLESLNEERKLSSVQDDLRMIDQLKVDLYNDYESYNGEQMTIASPLVTSDAINQSFMSPVLEDDEDWDSEDEIVSQQSDTPRNVSPKRASPIHQVSSFVSPKQTSPNHSSPKQTSPNHSSPKQTSPNHSSPKHVSPNHLSPKHASPTRLSPRTEATRVKTVIGGMMADDNQIDNDGNDNDDDDEKTESISEWEIERIKSKMKQDEIAVAADLSRRGYSTTTSDQRRGDVDGTGVDEAPEMDEILKEESRRREEWEWQNMERISSMVAEAKLELRKEEITSHASADGAEDATDGAELESCARPVVEVHKKEARQETYTETTTAFRGDDSNGAVTGDKPDSPKEELSHIQAVLGASAGQSHPVSIDHRPKLQLPDADHHSNKMALLSDGNSFYDDDDSVMSDHFMRDTMAQTGVDMVMPGVYSGDLGQTNKLYTPSVDDDGLSCTSTEDFICSDFIMPPLKQDFSQTTTTSTATADGSTTLRLQEQIRDQKRQLEREKYQHALLQNKHRCLNKDKMELDKKLESISQQRSILEQQKLEMDARIRSLEYSLTEESEKRRNAELLLKKTKEQLERKESQYTTEIEDKQKAELTLRNNTMELRSANVTIKQLTEQKEDLERMLSHERNARQIQDVIAHEQQLAQMKLHETSRNLDNERRYETSSDTKHHAEGSAERYKAELYGLKMELDRLQTRRNDEQTIALADAEALQAKVDDLKYDVKLNEEALSQATMQYNVQISQLRTENAMANSSLDKERAAREKLEAELESMRSRLNTTTAELEKSQTTRTELERLIQNSKEEWNKYSEKKEYEAKSLKDNSQSLQQRLHNSESRTMALENELHVANNSLMKSTDELNHLQRDVDQKKVMLENITSNYSQEKEKNNKLNLQIESLQQRLTAMQHENVSMKLQIDSSERALDDRNGAQLHSKLNSLMETIKADTSKNRTSMEEKNHALTETVTRLNEELRNSENKRVTVEMDLKRMHDEHNDNVKKLAAAECTLKITEQMRDQLEKEKSKLSAHIEKLTEKYQLANEKSIELGARVSGMTDAANQQSTSTQNWNSPEYGELYQQLSGAKGDMSAIVHRLEVENARLESELRFERQKADMLQKDLDDSQKVRSSLEALCANLKTTNQHLTGKLGEPYEIENNEFYVESNDEKDDDDDDDVQFLEEDEVMTKNHLVREAEASKDLWESEVVSKNKLSQKLAKGKRKVDELNSAREEEGHKFKQAVDAKRELEIKLRETESKLQVETEKNSQLQNEVMQLRTYLKLAMFRLNQCGVTDLDDKVKSLFETNQKELSEKMEKEFSRFRVLGSEESSPTKRPFLEPTEAFGLETMRPGTSHQEIERRYRNELNRKLADVNRYLEDQANGHDRLYRTWCERESSLKSEVKRVSNQLSDLKLKFEKAIAERETSSIEASRFRDLYGEKIKDSLHRNDLRRSPQPYKSRLSGSLSVPVSPFKLNHLKSNEKIREEILGAKLAADLDRSISRHLEAPPYDNLRPFVRSIDDNLKDFSDYDKPDNYRSLLRRMYLI